MPFRDMSFSAQQFELNRLSPLENWELVNVLERAGWQWRQSPLNRDDEFKGWWFHPDEMPTYRGDPKDLYDDARNVFLLYTDLDLDGELADIRAKAPDACSVTAWR